MSPSDKPADYHAGCNQALLQAVPAEALRILEVGCGEDRLGAALKSADPRRWVGGVEREPGAAAAAGRLLDRVFVLDVEKEDPALEEGSQDCLLYGDVLEHLADPLAVLRRHRRWLRPGGCLLACVPNVQHHLLVADLLRADFQYRPAGLLDRTHLRFFSYADLLKLLLDAGYAPQIVAAIPVPGPEELHRAAEPLLRYLGLHPGRTRGYLDAYQYVVRGDLLPEPEPGPAEPLTFAACVSDEATLAANLLASADLQAGSPHEVLLARGCTSAAEGLNGLVAQARHRWVVCVHQDVYLPLGWPASFVAACRQAEQMCGPLGVVGVYGVRLRGQTVERAGQVVDRDRLLREPAPLPAAVDTLDELLLALPRGTPLRFDGRLGFHFYGADLCLAARQRGLAAAAVEALCLHHSRSVGLPPAFYATGRELARKWAGRLPVATSCATVTAAWQHIDPAAARPEASLRGNQGPQTA